MSNSELVEWGAYFDILNELQQAARGSAGAPSKGLPRGKYPDGFGPGKGNWGA